ncbi:MAG: phosphopantetheine-binding protein [Verrucomicrobiota bacterium]
MEKQQANSRIAAIFETEFEVAPDRLLPEAHLFQDLGLDSIDIVEMIGALQKEFGIQLRDSEEARAIRTLGNLQDFVFNEIVKSGAGASPAPQS